MRLKLIGSTLVAVTAATAAVGVMTGSPEAGGRTAPLSAGGDTGQETVYVSRRPVDPGETEPGATWRPLHVGNLELVTAPFQDILRDSAAVIRGRVTDVSEPVLNIPAGQKYDPHAEYPQFITYHTVNVAVDHWMMSDGSISGDTVQITVPGGCYKDRITQDEIDALMLDPEAVAAGTEICRGEAVYGGLDFDAGDRVALLLVNSTVPFADGDRTAVTVSAYGVGLLREGAGGSLHQPGVDGGMPSAPESVGELQRMVREAGRAGP